MARFTNTDTAADRRKPRLTGRAGREPPKTAASAPRRTPRAQGPSSQQPCGAGVTAPRPQAAGGRPAAPKQMQIASRPAFLGPECIEQKTSVSWQREAFGDSWRTGMGGGEAAGAWRGRSEPNRGSMRHSHTRRRLRGRAPRGEKPRTAAHTERRAHAATFPHRQSRRCHGCGHLAVPWGWGQGTWSPSGLGGTVHTCVNASPAAQLTRVHVLSAGHASGEEKA